MWVSFIQSVEGFKRNDWEAKEEGVLPPDCSLTSRLKIATFPQSLAAQSALQILDLPVPNNMHQSLKVSEIHSLSLSLSLPPPPCTHYLFCSSYWHTCLLFSYSFSAYSMIFNGLPNLKQNDDFWHFNRHRISSSYRIRIQALCASCSCFLSQNMINTSFLGFKRKD
jgi:hypothetical protein